MPFKYVNDFDRDFLGSYDEPLGDEKTDSIFASNTKCRFSLDFPIARTCRPTPVCGEVCYGSAKNKPQARDIEARKHQVRVLRHFERTAPVVVADRIVDVCRRKRMFCIRWCGVGDLFPNAVRVINTIVWKHPDARQWVVTRKPEMAVQISRDAPNLWLMFSLDGSDDSKRRMVEVARHQHPRLYFSFLRVHPREDTLGAAVIFDRRMKMPPPSPSAGYVCPGDAGRFKDPRDPEKKRSTKASACTRCKWHCVR